ncbi:MAG: ABC transporter substrate-binding protein [Marinobacter sp.]|uniref:ABC transporter substrate-binding protein n=1 Tax=Marinobacter sp. TaxID=50741 RepID=UPI00299D6D76|nr:ABC transporter substrate-binding protein [Marinobacter sp.]MDX1756167.1 ABC transporter substrate-binding protein [Marinobacter sp.]
MRKVAALVLLVVSCWGHAQALSPDDSRPPRIGVFLVADTPFWNRVALFARAAGESLGAEIEVFNAGLDRVRMMRQLDWAARGVHGSFDALVFPNFLQTAVYMLEACERERITCVLFNSDLDAQEGALLGQPERRFRYWTAHLVPDDVQASAAMTQALVDRAAATRPERPLSMVGVNGYRADAPAVAREQGMRRVIEARDDVRIRQVVYTDWSGEDAYTRTLGLYHRYHELDFIWSANYRSTTGILRALKMAGASPGYDVFVNSFGLGAEMFRQLADGEIEITAGGHFVEGAWAVILAFDALLTPQSEVSGIKLHTPLLLVTQDNLDDVRLALERLESEPERVFDVDFRQFSRRGQPEPRDYRFSFEPILRALIEGAGATLGPVGTL